MRSGVFPTVFLSGVFVSMQIYDSILKLIGNTPVVHINHLDTGPCSLYIKLESQNPGGSIKDRIGLRMIEDAENLNLFSQGCLSLLHLELFVGIVS